MNATPLKLSPEDWEKEQRAKDAEFEARRHAQTAAAIKSYAESVEIQREIEARAEAARYEAARKRYLEEAPARAAAAQESAAAAQESAAASQAAQARAAARAAAAQEEQARAAARAASAAEESAAAARRAASRIVDCDTYYDAYGNAHTRCQ